MVKMKNVWYVWQQLQLQQNRQAIMQAGMSAKRMGQGLWDDGVFGTAAAEAPAAIAAARTASSSSAVTV
jgi:hypothetical protein